MQGHNTRAKAGERVLARFPVRAKSEATGAAIEIIEGPHARVAKLTGFDGTFSGLATLSDLRTALDEAQAFNATLDGIAPKLAGGFAP